jgi:hypothetical protein
LRELGRGAIAAASTWASAAMKFSLAFMGQARFGKAEAED